ncbi:redox-sensing transcriptional repressor Rex [Ruminococcaceae bacterium OttesenSCG-928-I18]|nr:redox-sensing transcriptional repressor Rex [Ruminococcaceae bacterium OttesenSCG-928-I18]
MANKISLPVIKRLPRYYRYVADLRREGVATVSSSELAEMLGTTASQVRQDFNCFGGFGQQGIGYNVDILSEELTKLLMGGSELSVILIGTGHLGRTMSHFLATEAPGYKLTAFFDKSPAEIGQRLEGLPIRDVENLPAFCKENQVDVAVLCIPEEEAAVLAPTLKHLGVRGFWNFSQYDLTFGEDVAVENVHLGDSLMSLGFRVRRGN